MEEKWLKISERILETKYLDEGEETFSQVVNRMLDSFPEELSFKEEMRGHLERRAFLPGGRILYSLGSKRRKNLTLSNCFGMDDVLDTLEDITSTLQDSLLTMKAGGGVGYYFGKLRPKDAPLANGSKSSGVVSFMKLFDTGCNVIKAGNSRRGAQIAILPIWHPEILDFITCKQGTLNNELTNFNISVGIVDGFFEAVENDEMWKLVFPNYMEYRAEYEECWGSHKCRTLRDWETLINEKYNNPGDAVVCYETIKARDLYERIIRNAYDFAEPGLIFLDNINNSNPINYCETINVTNPCGEQPLDGSNSCNLGHVNLTKCINYDKEFGFTFDLGLFNNIVKNGIIFLDAVLDVNWFPLERQKQEVVNKRIIGLGFTGLADTLCFLNLNYNDITVPNSDTSIFIETLSENFYRTAVLTSNQLSKLHGPFPLFDAEKYKLLDESIFTKEELASIREHGMRNARLLTIAPTGTTSLLADNVSSGIEPIFGFTVDRNIKNEDGSITLHENIPDYFYKRITELGYKLESFPNAITSSQVSPEAQIEMMAKFQRLIDGAISKTINLPADIKFEDEKFQNIYIDAWKKGLKGTTIYRPNENLSVVIQKATDKKLPVKEIESKGQLEIFEVEPSERHIVFGDNGEKIYLNFTYDAKTKRLKEVFVSIPKNAGYVDGKFKNKVFMEKKSTWTTICRLISLGLRQGITAEKIIHQLESSSYSTRDLSSLIKTAMENFVERRKLNNEENTKPTTVIGKECPACKKFTFVKENGCMICKTCGYSPCDE